MAIPGIPTTVLVAPDAFKPKLTAAEVCDAIARGLEHAGVDVDRYPIAGRDELDEVGFDQRMRAARAVVTGESCLDLHSLVGKVLSEVATRARQAGVPCHAIVGARELDSFGTRILDLQAVLQAGTISELERAGRELAALL